MLMYKTFFCIFLSALLLWVSFTSWAESSQEFDEQALDKTVMRALEEFHTPGLSLAIVKDGKLLYEKGYGFANIASNQPVTASSYFRLASVSKAFTAAGLAILVDEQKIDWEDKVIDYLPDFRLQDSYATEHFRVIDLFTHKSGLPSGAGNSMIWPEPSGFNRDEVVENLRHFRPEYPFATKYAYSNVLYITAGQLIEKVSQKPFDDFIDERLFTALEMDCFTGAMPEKAVNNAAMPYGHNDKKGLYPIPRNAIKGDALMSAAAGGMVCSAREMSKWLIALLSAYHEKPNASLPFSTKQLKAMWSRQTILSVSDNDYEWDGTLFRSYGIGWRLANIDKYQFISHTGTLSGYQAYLGLIPELELGVIILNNGSNSGARGAVMQQIIKTFIDSEQTDWVKKYREYQAIREQQWISNHEEPKARAPMSIDDEQIIGTYKDKWFDYLVISQGKDGLRIQSSRMSTLTGNLSPFQDATYKIDWDNENAQSDAFIHFELNVQREITGAKLHPFTNKVRTNHEYRDMHFIKLTDH